MSFADGRVEFALQKSGFSGARTEDVIALARTVRDGLRVLRSIGTEWALEKVVGTDRRIAPEHRQARPVQHPPWNANGRSVHRPGLSESGALIRGVQ